MGKRLSLIGILVVTVAALVATFSAGNSPLLGLGFFVSFLLRQEVSKMHMCIETLLSAV